uniref:Ig-like domain-containing protein n=1 Tax=Lepisosteus oculatus TaxID=7918 RepID=W5LX37_LEPOC
EVTVSQPQSSVTADAGDSVTLICTVSRQALGPVKWSRGTGPQKQQLDIKPPETPGHISWATRNHPTEKSIVISELSLRDSGVYYCEWYRPSQDQPSASGSGTTLTVRARVPIVPTVKIKSPEEMFLNQTVNISCLVSGFFPHSVSVSWEPMTLSRTPVQDQNCTKIQNQDGTYSAELWAWFLFKAELNGSVLACVATYRGL